MRRLALFVRLPAVCSILMIAGPAWPDPAPQPLLKRGSCPSGYYVSGNYCTPGSNARFAVEKRGSCPSGYHVSGDYCLSGASGRAAIPKIGSCPSGWIVSGDYCLERR